METDFYEDLIPLEKNKNEQISRLSNKDNNFYVPIFYSSSKSQNSNHNSAFKQAIQASHKKVIKMVSNSFILFWKLIPIPTIMQ